MEFTPFFYSNFCLDSISIHVFPVNLVNARNAITFFCNPLRKKKKHKEKVWVRVDGMVFQVQLALGD